MKIACVTAITGGYDQLIHNHPNYDNSQFICFTDNLNQQSPLWEIRPAYHGYNGWDADVRNYKRHKILIHEYVDCKYSLWIDGNITLHQPVFYLIRKFMQDCDIAMFKHNRRSCIYREAKACIQTHLDCEDTIQRQVEKYYHEECYPARNGLYWSGFILRRHTKAVADFNTFWWDEVCSGSKRDQISLPYSLWKTGVKINSIDPALTKTVLSVGSHAGVHLLHPWTP